MIGSFIKKKREDLNLSMKNLSDKLNISIQRLTNFETETRCPSLELLKDLSILLNFDIDNLNKPYKNKEIDINLFKENIIKYRTKNNLTLQNLSDKINISRQTISKWEKGESYPNIDTFYEICNILNLKPSSLICKPIKKKLNKKLYLLFLLALPLLLIPLLIPKTKELPPDLPQKPIPTEPNEVPVIPEELYFITESTINLINDSTSLYNLKNHKEYSISFNDPNLSDITYNPNEPFFLPYYFDDEKYIDHYLYKDEVLSGLTTLNLKENIKLTPVYVTYEDYYTYLTYTTSQSTQLIELNNNNIYTFIIPESLSGLKTFEIRTIPNHIKTLICDYSYLVFNGININHLPQAIFINSKNIEFINNKTYETLHFTAINQTNDYIKETTFPNVLIEYLYIHNKENYTNTVIFNNVKNIIKP